MIEINISFRDCAKVEITGDTSDLYVIDFIDQDTNISLHKDTLMCNMWTKTARKYFTNWKIVISTIDGKLVKEETFDASGKEVLIAFGSNSLGDNLAWIPYCEEFRKKHNCKMFVQTVVGDLFSESYPEITFLPPWKYQLDDKKFYASYFISMGVELTRHRKGIAKLNDYFKRNIPIKYIDGFTFWNKDEHTEHPALIPLQKIATNVLGLEFTNKKPVVPITNPNRPIEGKYVCISEFASAEGMKMWQNQIGWKTVVEELKNLGYEVVSISKEKSKLKNVTKRNGNYPLSDRVWYLQHADFFIGMSSGLSWLSWFVSTPTVVISGHTKKWYEPEDVIRVINEDVCHGCHNVPEHADKFCCFHTSFCPTNKNFVCTRAISPKMVLDTIKQNNLIK